MKPLENHRILGLTLMAVIVMAAVALPMAPVWEAALRVLAVFVLIGYLPARLRLPFGMVAAGTFIGYAAYWCIGFMHAPMRTLVDAVTDVYGVPIGTVPNAALLGLDILVVTALAGYALRAAYANATMRWCIRLLLGFGLAALASTAHGVFQGYADAATLFASTSAWAIWIMAALLVMLLCDSKYAVEKLVKSLAFGGVVVASVSALQWLLNDFSYVLDSLWFNEYYQRVRGTYYYYTPASFAVAMTSMLVAAMVYMQPMRRKLWAAIAICMLVLVLANGSRGLALACAVAFIGAAVFFAMKRRWFITLMVLIVSASMVMLAVDKKPVSGGITEPAVLAEACELGFVKTADIRDEAFALEAKGYHASRNSLFAIALQQLPQNPVLGAGIGDSKLPLPGNSFGGITSTYSSHVLYLDIALMAGIPALLMMVGFFGLVAITNGYQLFNAKLPAREQALRLSLMMALMVFGVTGCFLGQEQDHLRMVGFVLAALILAYNAAPNYANESTPFDQSRTTKKLTRAATLLVMLGVGVWSVATSATYVFPAAEFVGRYRHELKANPLPVYVNNTTMGSLLRAAFTPLGIASPVKLLADDAKQLPTSPAWVLWGSAYDAHYPNLRCVLGYRNVRKNMLAPSVAFHPAWWLLPNAQNTTSFIYTGLRDFDAGDGTVIERVRENIAPTSLVLEESESSLRNVADANLGSYMSVTSLPQAQVVFAMPKDRNTTLVAYRLYPHQFSAPHTAKLYDWTVDVSDNGRRWNRIDRQTQFDLSRYKTKGRVFRIPALQPATFIRFTFASPRLKPDAIAGIAEIELYTK